MDPNQLEDVTSFTYLGSVINIGGSEEDAKARIGKARTTFNILNVVLAFPILAFASSSDPPSILITLPMYVKLVTSSSWF